MKRIMFLCAVIFGFAALAAFRIDAQPEFKFQSETHDFGKITQGKPVSFEFKFTNIGDQPLIISNVKPACGCTIADYTKTPVKKGESGFIKLTYSAASLGPFSKTATVVSNSKMPQKFLYIKGEVVTADGVTAANSSK